MFSIQVGSKKHIMFAPEKRIDAVHIEDPGCLPSGIVIILMIIHLAQRMLGITACSGTDKRPENGVRVIAQIICFGDNAPLVIEVVLQFGEKIGFVVVALCPVQPQIRFLRKVE